MSNFEPGLSPEVPLMTPEQFDTREVVDELFEYSDMMAHNVMSAIHGRSLGEVWDKNNETGMWYRVSGAKAEAEPEVVAVDTQVVEPAEKVATVTSIDAAPSRRRVAAASGPTAVSSVMGVRPRIAAR